MSSCSQATSMLASSTVAGQGFAPQLLRAGRTITVDDTWRGNPEAGVAGVMRRQGYKVFYAENTLWHCLFGLLFWDELFETGQLHSGFDWVPHCLKDRSFATAVCDRNRSEAFMRLPHNPRSL